MASESMAHLALASWAIDSEPIRARGIIIVKYWDCVESLFIVSYKLDIFTSICDIFGLSSYVPPFWLTDFVFNLTAHSYPFHSFSTLETTSQTKKRKEKNVTKVWGFWLVYEVLDHL